VARRIDGEDGEASEFEKAVRVRVRAAGGRWPCNEYNVVESGRRGVRI